VAHVVKKDLPCRALCAFLNQHFFYWEADVYTEMRGLQVNADPVSEASTLRKQVQKLPQVSRWGILDFYYRGSPPVLRLFQKSLAAMSSL